MRGSVFVLILVFFGCNSHSENKIVVPKLHAGFYSEALDRINDKLKSDPENNRLVDQKLFYCNQLGWPTTCISALDAYKQTHGMTNQLVEQYIAYYKRHERYQLLLEVIDKWKDEYELETRFTELYIDALTRMDRSKTAKLKLREYLKDRQGVTALTFASQQYLMLRDTAMAAYNLGKLQKLDPQNEMMWQYGNLLVALGYENRGFEVMKPYVDKHQEDLAVQITYAGLLENANQNALARQTLKPFTSRDTVAYMLTKWYQKDFMWDSASYILIDLIEKDSSARKPVWKLGRLYEDRGWFLSSIPYFEYLTELDPSDTLAVQRIDLIQRKIAYLQRLKFEENKIPTIELQPKKIEN